MIVWKHLEDFRPKRLNRLKMDQQVVLSNKKSKKIGYKRRDALSIANQIRQFLADRGILLPHSSAGVFGRGFKTTEVLKNEIRREINEVLELDGSLQHRANYAKHVKKRMKAITFLPYDAGLKIPENYDEFAVRRSWSKMFPLSFDAFTELAYKKIEVERIKKVRREHADKCIDRSLPVFTDRSTGEILYDEYNQLARAHYALWQNSPAAYALFKHPTQDNFSTQGIAFTCSKHRIDPVWNYLKSKRLRASVHGWMKKESIHERYQPMHLVLTVPHPGGVWTPPGESEGLTFYAKEMVEKFNLMRKSKAWNKYIYGGLLCLEITRKGANGLHIHIHAMVLQRPEFDRNEVHEYISAAWEQLSGGMSWYETLYIHKRTNEEDKRSPWIMETDEHGNKVWDESRQEFKKKKYYLDNRYEWFQELSAEEKFNTYVSGVLECIKYHFKYESFKTGRKIEGTKVDEWDVQLIADVLRYSKNLRMYDKFGKLYGVKELGMNYIDKLAVKDITVQASVEGDGVEENVINPFTKKLAIKGEYERVLALPQFIEHYGQYQNFRTVNVLEHDIYFLIKPDIPIRRVIAAIMKKTWADILPEPEYRRLKDCDFKFLAPRERIWGGFVVNKFKKHEHHETTVAQVLDERRLLQLIIQPQHLVIGIDQSWLGVNVYTITDLNVLVEWWNKTIRYAGDPVTKEVKDRNLGHFHSALWVRINLIHPKYQLCMADITDPEMVRRIVR